MVKKQIAYSYVRFSTPDQIKGDSLRRQTEWSVEWCEKNEYILNDLTLHDLGVSAYKGKNAETGALGTFIDAIESGQVSKGSILLVESLDRLSRNEIMEALELFLSILRRGVKIVTRQPPMEFSRSSINDVGNIIVAIVTMSRAHEESEIKSYRLKESWESKRKNIGKKKLTNRCPAWLKISEDRTEFIVDKEKAATVKKIFRLSAEGYGINTITKKLNSESVPTIARSKKWNSSYITKILSNRAVLGEFTPRHGRGGTKMSARPAAGETITDYYPQIVSEAQFYKAQKEKQNRKIQKGPVGKIGVTNLFTGLVRDARDNSTMNLVNKGNGDKLVSSAARRGEPGAEYLSFPYDVFEESILSYLQEVSPSDILPPKSVQSDQEEQLDIAEGKLSDVEHRLETFKKRLIEDENFETLLEVVKDLETEKENFSQTIERIKGNIHQDGQNIVSDSQSLIGLMKQSEGEELEKVRTRLKSKIVNLIDDIFILVTKHGHHRLAIIQIHFIGGGYRNVFSRVYRGKKMMISGSCNTTEYTVDVREENNQNFFVDLFDSLFNDDDISKKYRGYGSSALKERLSIHK